MFHWVITQVKEMCMLSSKLDIFGIPFFLHENANRQWACSCALLGEIKGICWKIMDTYFQLVNPLMAWVGLKIFCLQNMMGCEQGITGKLTSTFFLMWQILQEIRSWTNMLYLKLGEMVNMARAEQLFYSLFYIYNGSINLIQFKPCYVFHPKNKIRSDSIILYWESLKCTSHWTILKHYYARLFGW